MLAAIVTASDDAIVSKLLDGTILSWNTGAERLFGYSAEEAIGQSINLIIPEHLRDEERSILNRLRHGERIEHFETMRVAKDGRQLEISLTVSPVRNETGKIVGASKVARDITEQKRIQAALAASEERFRELANNIDQFAWTCDRLGLATWYNQRWYEYTGTAPDAMHGDGWRAVHHPEHVDRVEASLMRAVKAEEAWEETFPLRGADGEYRWFLSRAVPIRNRKGHVIRWFGTNTDITAQRDLELALREAVQRQEEFLATLSHELRNPLAPISNSLEALRVADDDPDLRQQARDAISRQISHLVRLVDDLLDVSRISRDRLELRKSRTELGSLIRDVTGVWRALAEREQLRIDCVLPDEPIYLQIDADRVTQVLNNLLNNACKFSPRRGIVRLSVDRASDYVVVTVTDHGVGIPADKLETIFDMFTQLRDDDNPVGGMGVGLTLVKRLVELHGGSIHARSNGPGQGSEFIMRLPISEEAPTAAQSAPTAAVDHRGSLRILIVDDNVDNAESLSMLLRLNGHRTLAVYDGQSAIDAADQFRPDALLLDLGLPKLSGIDVCRRIRSQPWGRDMKIVAITGWGQQEDHRRSAEAGFDCHLVKPIEYEKLHAAISGTKACDR